MAKLGINTGSAPDAGDGDSILEGAVKIISNFDEIYSLLGDGTDLSTGIVTSIVAGDNIQVSGNTGQVTINSSPTELTVTEESQNVGTSGTINFVGSGITATIDNGIIQVSVAGIPTDTGDLTNTAGYITAGSTFSGAYADLTGTPTIPSDTSDLTNNAGFITSSSSAVGLTSLTGASEGTYGDTNNVAQISVDANGRITSITDVSISGSGGATALNGLTDVSISNLSTGQVLKYDGSNWINDTDATGGSSGIAGVAVREEGEIVGTSGTINFVGSGLTVALNNNGFIEVSVVGLATTGALVGLATTGALVGLATTGALVGLATTGALVGLATTGALVGLATTGALVGLATTGDVFSGDYGDLTNTPTIPSDINSLSDVTISNATNGQVLKYNGSGWINDTDATAASGIAGIGISEDGSSVGTAATSINFVGTGVSIVYNSGIATVSITTSFSGDYADLTNAPTIPTVNNGTLTLATSGDGITGSDTFTANQSDDTTFTVTVSSASTNEGSTLVYRDADGGFSAGVVNATALSGFDYLGAPHGTTVGFAVTVGTKTAAHRYSGGSSNGYFINGVESPFLTLTPGRTYRFDQSDTSNQGHRLKFYLEADKTTAYTTDVTTAGTLGNTGAYTEIVVGDETPIVLHYQCESHDLMGNAAQANSNKVNSPYGIVGAAFSTANGTSSQFLKADGSIDGNTYLTAETSHNDVLVDGDFGSEGFMKRGASSGTYSIDSNTYLTTTGDGSSLTGVLTATSDGSGLTGIPTDGDFTSNGFMKRTGNGTYGVDTNSYLTTTGDGSSLTGVLTATSDGSGLTGIPTDGDFTSNGFLVRTGDGTYTVDTNSYLTAETDHSDVLVDSDFGSEGFMKRGASEGTYTVDTNTYLTATGDGSGLSGVVTSIVAGSNITIDTDSSSGIVTVNNTAGNSFSIISVSGKDNPSATTPGDTLELIGGTNISLDTNTGTDPVSVTINATGNVSSQWTTSGSDIYYNTTGGGVAIGTDIADTALEVRNTATFHISDTNHDSWPNCLGEGTAIRIGATFLTHDLTGNGSLSSLDASRIQRGQFPANVSIANTFNNAGLHFFDWDPQDYVVGNISNDLSDVHAGGFVLFARSESYTESENYIFGLPSQGIKIGARNQFQIANTPADGNGVASPWAHIDGFSETWNFYGNYTVLQDKFETTDDGVKVFNGTKDTAVISGPRNLFIDPSPDDVVAITTGAITASGISSITGITTTNIGVGDLVQEVDGLISAGTTVIAVGINTVEISKVSLGSTTDQEFSFSSPIPTGIVRIKGDLHTDGKISIGSSLYDANGLAGNNGQVLSNITGFGVSWANLGISDGDKGDITVTNEGNTWTIDNDVVGPTQLANTAVTAGTYSNANITVDSQGRITSASSGGGSGGSYSDADVDTHLNRDGNVGVSSVLSWNGSDYEWITSSGNATVNGSFNATAGVAYTANTYIAADFSNSEYTLFFQHNDGIQSQKVLIMDDGANVYSQEYAIMSSNNTLVSVGATLKDNGEGMEVELWLTPEDGVTGILTYKFTRRTITA